MNILVIEDELSVSSFIKRGFEEQNNQVMQAFDGESGLKLARQYDFNVIICDIVMPLMNGIEVCNRLKNQYKSNTPILLLTALGSTDDIVLGLEKGADDYLIKPFKFKELLARVNALNRRFKNSSFSNVEILKVKDLTLNLNTKEVYWESNLVKLTSREFKFLKFLLNNKNRVVSRVEILESVWEVDFDLGTNVIDVYINYLRKKIEKPFNIKIIETVIGMGYIIKD